MFFAGIEACDLKSLLEQFEEIEQPQTNPKQMAAPKPQPQPQPQSNPVPLLVPLTTSQPAPQPVPPPVSQPAQKEPTR